MQGFINYNLQVGGALENHQSISFFGFLPGGLQGAGWEFLGLYREKLGHRKNINLAKRIRHGVCASHSMWRQNGTWP